MPAADLQPEKVLVNMEKGRFEPFYLFYGEDEFRLEKALERIRGSFIPEALRDLNQEVSYGGECAPVEIMERARSLPFMAERRLIIVRRTERFTADQLKAFLPYLESPSESTCLIFISSKFDLRRAFYARMRDLNRAVRFRVLNDSQVQGWIKRTAKEMGIRIDGEACAYLRQIVGNGLRDLYVELEKLSLSFGEEKVGVSQVKEVAVHSRMYTIFELMNAVSGKQADESLRMLNRFLETEKSRDACLGIMGMLNRQMRMLWYTKGVLARGGTKSEVARKLAVPLFSASDFIKHAGRWSLDDLEGGLRRLYEADGRLKSGSSPKLIMENLVLSLCGSG